MKKEKRKGTHKCGALTIVHHHPKHQQTLFMKVWFGKKEAVVVCDLVLLCKGKKYMFFFVWFMHDFMCVVYQLWISSTPKNDVYYMCFKVYLFFCIDYLPIVAPNSFWFDII